MFFEQKLKYAEIIKKLDSLPGGQFGSVELEFGTLTVVYDTSRMHGLFIVWNTNR